VRSALARIRLQLLRSVRERCSDLRAELRDVASAVPVGGSADFEKFTSVAAARFVVELDEEITRAVGAAATDGRQLPDVSRSSSASRRLESRLMTVLGAGFGLGIALASSRLVAGFAPGLSVVGLAAGGLAGLALVFWVVRVRGLLHDRALLDRWVTEVGATLRWHGESMIAERLLSAESEWADATAARSLERQARRPLGGAPLEPKWIRLDVTDQYEW
jgi:hypothetical protein